MAHDSRNDSLGKQQRVVRNDRAIEGERLFDRRRVADITTGGS
jgi:hypothetical protein